MFMGAARRFTGAAPARKARAIPRSYVATMTPNQQSQPSRRGVLAAGAAVVLAPLVFDAPAASAASTGAPAQTQTLTGTFTQGPVDYAYLPVRVPTGVTRIDVKYTYDKPTVPAGTPGNSLDIGIFDERGVEMDGKGFRGWSGGFRTEFFIAGDQATPGYIPGPIHAGTWNVILAPYQVTPQGLTYTVEVTLTYGTAAVLPAATYPPETARGRGRAWYRGDGHLHTVYSDGKYTPDEVAAGARAAGLDFMVTTDHNTHSAHRHWASLAGDDLLIMLGEEVTTRNGHWVAMGIDPEAFIDWRYRAADGMLERYVRKVHRAGGLAVAAHIYCPWIGCEWKYGFDEVDAMEVWTGPWGWDDDAAVATWSNMLSDAARGRGRAIPAVGHSDAHGPGNVVGLPQTVVLAEALSRDAILDGIKKGRSWIAGSKDVQLDFTVSGPGGTAQIGDTYRAAADAQFTVTAKIAGVPNGTVRILTDQGQMLMTVLPASGAGTVTWVSTPQAAAYARVEVRLPKADGTPGGTGMGPTLMFGPMAALSNPVWIATRRRDSRGKGRR